MKSLKSATAVSNIFTLKDLFSLPLQAVIEANASAAETAIGFIEKYGFTQLDTIDPEHWGELKFVFFTYEYNEGGVLKTMTIKIPLISLIPIPLLEVKNAVFDFGVKIIDYSTNPILTEANKRASLSSGNHNVNPSKISAMIVPVNKGNETVTQKQPSLTANLNVHIEMVKADLPAGILQLMNIGQQATQGQSTDNYLLSTNVSKIIFNDNFLVQELIINIKRTDDKPVKNEKVVLIEIKRNVDFSSDILAEAQQVLDGDLIGVATTIAIKALSNNSSVKVSFKAKANFTNNNGFIKVSCSGADDLFIYYTNF
jgi:hypothetical protein